MNREALEQTVRVLEDVIKFRLAFDLKTFIGVSDYTGYNCSLWSCGDPDLQAKFKNAMEKEQFLLIPHNCGCTACATGYAGLDPWFIERGFKTTKEGGLRYGDFIDWAALMAFYQLSSGEADYLFTNHFDYTTPEDVIDRISSVLTEGFPEDISDED